jgi:hypothetical protein
MIVSVFVRRLKEGCTFEDFVKKWEADQGFGVPTRVFNAQSLDDPKDVISIGFVAVTVDELQQGLAASAAPESVRHDRISTVIESTTLRCMYEVKTEHDFTVEPNEIGLGSIESLLSTFGDQTKNRAAVPVARSSLSSPPPSPARS